ncbi:MAG: hypothetical protein QOE79_747 [Sphingomonadales bacterium]|nr:hypothetical protein [Sphingomonadales bacterium]MEA3049138.1 hypothetical protein [Sphingomonadales bacterium]
MGNEVTYTPTEDQSVDAARDWYWHVLRRRRTAVKALAICLVCGALFAGISWFYGDDLDDVAIGFGEGFAYGVVLFVLVWAGSYLVLPWRIRRLFRQHRVREGDYRWRWGPEGISLATPNGEMRYAWSELHRVVEGRHTFLLFFNDRQYLGLPTAALDPAQIESFRAESAAHGVPG